MKFLNNLKNPFNNPRFKHGAYAVMLSLGVIVGIVLVNLIITTLASKVPLKIDMTKDKLFELSPQTIEVVKGLKSEVKVYALYSSSWENDNSVRQIKEYLDRYQKLSPNFKLEYVDPIKNTTFAQKYQQNGENVGSGSIVMESGKNVKVIGFNDMMSSQQDPTGQGPGTQSIQVEQKLTGGLIYVTTGAGGKVYIISGHGSDTAVGIKTLLTASDYAVADLNLLATDIPDDASMVVLSNAEKDLAAPEVEKLDKFFDKGGKGIFLFSAGYPKLATLEGYISEWGIDVSDDLVIEEDPNKFMSPKKETVFPDMQLHDITKNLINQSLVFIAPGSKSLTIKADNPQRATVTSLLKTSAKSFGKKNYQNYPQQSAMEPGDVAGPLDICAIALRDTGDAAKSPKILVMGAGFSFDEQILNYPDTANSDFLLNSFSWMTDKKENLSIRAKDITPEKLSLTRTSFIFTILSILLVLILIAGAGFFVWFRRRFK